MSQRTTDLSAMWEAVGDEFHVVVECGGQQVPRQMHNELFEAFGGWSHISPADLPTDATRTFTAQEPRWVVSLIHACEQRAQDDPPDAVVFGDHVESSDEFHDCIEGGDDVDVFAPLDRVLASEGNVPGTP